MIKVPALPSLSVSTVCDLLLFLFSALNAVPTVKITLLTKPGKVWGSNNHIVLFCPWAFLGKFLYEGFCSCLLLLIWYLYQCYGLSFIPWNSGGGNNKGCCLFVSLKSKEQVWWESFDSSGVAGDRGKGTGKYQQGEYRWALGCSEMPRFCVSL